MDFGSPYLYFEKTKNELHQKMIYLIFYDFFEIQFLCDLNLLKKNLFHSLGSQLIPALHLIKIFLSFFPLIPHINSLFHEVSSISHKFAKLPNLFPSLHTHGVP